MSRSGSIKHNILQSGADGRTVASISRVISAAELEEARMVALKIVLQPDEIKLLNSALDEAALILPKAERTSAMKVKLASRILAAATKGERDPNKLRIAALLEEMDV
jgi:hypothetical protein